MGMRKVTINQLHRMKSQKSPIVALGVYDAPMASIADQIGFEIFVIGNSGPMSLFGCKQSTEVDPRELLYMTQGVSRVTERALVVATMPYMSYQSSKSEAVKTAAWLVKKGGADCVQCHGNKAIVENIQAIVQAGIPVLAHIGLQSVNKVSQGGYRVHGKTAEEVKAIVEDALALVKAGVFAFTAELMVNQLAVYLSHKFTAPVLSLGSGPNTDGSYLVSGDAVGYSAFPSPKTAAQYTEVMPLIEVGLNSFVEEVRHNKIPYPENIHHMNPGEKELFESMLTEKEGR
ncbi:MAG: 3-methyl-2-oxobutanoate hydroxymethyltransferase [Deltaproteobacteria bacterium]|nr:3-methyl-2-oxobutanoate hydroxymethyltransferase [Deltaproteobacteria bacterium]